MVVSNIAVSPSLFTYDVYIEGNIAQAERAIMRTLAFVISSLLLAGCGGPKTYRMPNQVEQLKQPVPEKVAASGRVAAAYPLQTPQGKKGITIWVTRPRKPMYTPTVWVDDRYSFECGVIDVVNATEHREGVFVVCQDKVVLLGKDRAYSIISTERLTRTFGNGLLNGPYNPELFQYTIMEFRDGKPTRYHLIALQSRGGWKGIFDNGGPNERIVTLVD